MRVDLNQTWGKRFGGCRTGKVVGYVQLELDHSWLPVKGQEARILDWAHGVGYLWTGKVRTSPIEIEIPASPPSANCSFEFRLDRLE